VVSGSSNTRGLDLPDIHALEWLDIVSPASALALPLATDLGPGEREVLALVLERREAALVLDDRVARNVVRTLGLKMTGTLGLLLDAKSAGRIERVEPPLNELGSLGFRLAVHTRAAVLKLAGELARLAMTAPPREVVAPTLPLV
jgi:hypothetical protein